MITIGTFVSSLMLLPQIISIIVALPYMLDLYSPQDIHAHAILSCTPDQRPHYSDISQLSNTATSDQQ